MEAIAAVALAGNAAQFVEYSIKAIQKTYELLNSPDGAWGEIAELKTVVESVELSMQIVRDSQDGSKNGPVLDKILEGLVADCLAVSDEISELLDGLKLDDPSASFFQALQKTVKSLAKKPQLKELCGRLHNLRDQISAHLLVLIR